MDLADTAAEVEAIEAEIAALEGELPSEELPLSGYAAYTGGPGRGKRGTKRGRSASKLEAAARPARARKPTPFAAAAAPPSLNIKDKKKDLAEKIKQLERQIAKEAAETKMIKETDSEERKMQMQIEALQRKLEETKQAKEKALKKAQKEAAASLAKEYMPTPVKVTPSKRGQKAMTPAPTPVPAVQDESTRQYCYCKKLWDQSVPMIGCDACDEWYHLSCLGMFSSEAVCIESYVCVTCQHKKLKNKLKTQYKSDEVMAIEISQMPAELVAREIDVVKSELRELAGREAEAIISAIESPPPALEPDLSPVPLSSLPSSSCSSSSSSLPTGPITPASPTTLPSTETPSTEGESQPPPLETSPTETISSSDAPPDVSTALTNGQPNSDSTVPTNGETIEPQPELLSEEVVE